MRRRRRTRSPLERCNGKVCYPSENQALSVVERKLSYSPTDFLRVYICPACSTYHLTSKPKRFWLDERPVSYPGKMTT